MKFILLLFLYSASVVAAEKTEIVMGFNPAENAASMETKSKALSDYFESHIGVKVKIFVATDYTALIEAMRSGNIDLAWLPPFSYVQAEKMAHAKVLLKIVRHGRSDMFSAIITRTDRHLNTLHDLKGKSIAWVDPASASGHIIPKAAVIEKEKVDPDIFFGKQVFAGGHDAVVLAVYNGTVDAGATWLNDKFGKDGAWNLYLKKDSDKIHVSFISEAIPTDTLATTELFSTKNPALLAKTVSLLQSMSKDEAGGKVLRDLYGIDALIPAKNSDYDIIRRAAVATGISKK